MPKIAPTLTLDAIRKRCREARATGKKRTFCMSPGLYLQVRGDNASALFRYSRGHGDRARVSDFGLGAFDPFNYELAAGHLSNLRARVHGLQQQRHSGRDPIAERAARRAATAQVQEAREQKAASNAATFQTMADAWLRTHEPRAAEFDATGKLVRPVSGWSLSHYQQTVWQLQRYVFPAVGSTPVADVTQRDIRDILEPLWYSKHVTAARLRTAMQGIFDVAIADADIPFSGPNLAVYEGGLKHLLPNANAPKPRNYVGVPRADVPGVVASLLAVGGLRETALVLAILTACRSVNAREATWGEIDFATATWTISGAKMKNALLWRSPLPAAALDLLAALRPKEAGPEDYVFPSIRGGCIGPNSLRFALRDIGRSEHVHGFRSVARTFWADNGFDHRAAEFQLSHVEGSATVKIYQRSDLVELRRPMLDRWAAHCLGTTADNVVPLRTVA